MTRDPKRAAALLGEALDRIRREMREPAPEEREPDETSAARLERRLRAVGVPPAIAGDVMAPRFNAFRPAVAEAMAFVLPSDPRRLLVIGGATGVGKSVAAAAAAASAVTAEREVGYLGPDGAEGGVAVVKPRPLVGRWVHATEVHAVSTYDDEFWARLTRVEMLVVDDAGSEQLDAGGYGAQKLANLLAVRDGNGGKTIVTTNATREVFVRTYCTGAGARLADRLRDHGNRGFYTVPGKSLRGAP